MKEILYGRQAVRECLRAHRRHIHRVLLAEGVKETGIITEILTLAQALKVPSAHVPRVYLEGLSEAAQGVGLEVGAYPYVSVDEILKSAQKYHEPPFLLALDHLQDPHNFGALVRTAEAVGVHGVIIPERRAVGVTPAVVSASAGASEHMRIAQVTNLVRTLKALKTEGVWIVGLENTPDSLLYHTADLNRPLVLLVGAEGLGISRLARETCDMVIRLPMRGHVQSLNASVAGGIALYAAWAARGFPSHSVDTHPRFVL
ncbi:MAG: 23S rRNA (guanosine(2251)-2'-O)-methyltransferase RlmB [Anaerolineae bacterium]|nr:23S rRNA (guanosine(2251)-2'-O)-methyltransferase RlmB [Anaerolineae bacterium]MDW8071758.1 23S rRNA (guanosine(2251)-2'-O)-methyltransferase RlmB [Anaerolineae bacterium]